MKNPTTEVPAVQQGDTGTDRRSARWDAHRTARRIELIKLARRAIHELGPNASMEDIAAHANTSKPVFYRYFGDKDGLRHAVGEFVIKRFRAGVIAAGRKSNGNGEALHAMMLAYLQMASNSLRSAVTSVLAAGALSSPAMSLMASMCTPASTNCSSRRR